MPDLGVLGLMFLGLALGLRHGIDWDHIAAITDITGSVVTNDEADAGAELFQSGEVPSSNSQAQRTLETSRSHSKQHEAREGIFLATMYALGHASVVVLLGLLALWAGAILPDWLDPTIERLVGVTLIFLGFWIFYSIWRYGRSFRLQSRWMVLFSLLNQAWTTLKNRLTGESTHPHDSVQYGSKTAFGIGMIHGIGAETGSQALLLAATVGTTTKLTGSLLLLAFTIGLLLSNSLIAVFSVLGFVSVSTKRNIYSVVGVVAAAFSLFVGFFFVTGQEAKLPDLTQFLNHIY